MTTILLVGCGKMGEALATGWLDQGIDPDNITDVEPVKINTRIPGKKIKSVEVLVKVEDA